MGTVPVLWAPLAPMRPARWHHFLVGQGCPTPVEVICGGRLSDEHHSEVGSPVFELQLCHLIAA